ncbi:MAG: type II toxin-antitoxin system HicB family antitoxin [Planctomycetota bacterium]|jgi:predicted RNase H-like HicB family nuclease|nr:type II toxin-antitoxin system HicB family antitoxin [Planctomycetota bacterium]
MKNRSFIVVDGDLRLRVVRTDKWYVASSLDVAGLYTQGKTIEEVIDNAHDAAKCLAESHARMLRELAAAKPCHRSGVSNSRKRRLAVG